jgi:hypothetical protein
MLVVPRRINRTGLSAVSVRQTGPRPLSDKPIGAGDRTCAIRNDCSPATVPQPLCGTLSGSPARPEERTMNTSAVDTVVVELTDEHLPAEALIAWAERPSDAR